MLPIVSSSLSPASQKLLSSTRRIKLEGLIPTHIKLLVRSKLDIEFSRDSWYVIWPAFTSSSSLLYFGHLHLNLRYHLDCNRSMRDRRNPWLYLLDGFDPCGTVMGFKKQKGPKRRNFSKRGETRRGERKFNANLFIAFLCLSLSLF